MFASAMRKTLAAALLLVANVNAQTCLMVYQLADTDKLEPFIRQDLAELATSPVIRSELLRTWVYHDSLNQGGAALPHTIDTNGNPVGAFTGSRYLTYDPSSGNMKVVVELPNEVDSDSQAAKQAFMEHAMADCLAGGFTSFMTVFSSHGTGFGGFGGDLNRGGRRGLLQTNTGIANAIRGALDSTEGAPEKVDVLGFDACNMMAFEAADDFGDVANYLLASEALEPGHGWHYSYLTTATSALELAKQIVATFLGQTGGGSSHQTPKTLAVLNLEEYAIFLTAFEDFSSHLLTNLQAGDVSLHSFTSRSRSAAVSYEGFFEQVFVGLTQFNMVDIGSWLAAFSQLCNPIGEMGTSLQAAQDGYTNMFVVEGVGPRTAPGTGMHLLWPNQGLYLANQETQDFFDNFLFFNPDYVTSAAPNFRAFLRYFLSSGNSGAGGGDSVCGGPSAIPQDPGPDPNALIYDHSGTLNEQTGIFEVTAEIGPKVDQMVTQYAIDLSTALKPELEKRGYTPASDEYLILMGGDLRGVSSGSSFSTSWDQNFYFLNISGVNEFEALYVMDEGGGSKSVPVMYFPEEKREAVSELGFLDFILFDFEYWLAQGAVVGYLKFSVNETEGRINDNLSLYTSDGQSLFELSREAGGMLMPLIYVDGYIQGQNVTELPGGFNQTIINWNPDLSYNVLTTNASQVFSYNPSIDAVMINLYALDHGDPDRGPEIRRYDVVRRTRSTGTTPGTAGTSGTPDAEAGAAGSDGAEDSSAAGGMFRAFELFLAIGLFQYLFSLWAEFN